MATASEWKQKYFELEERANTLNHGLDQTILDLTSQVSKLETSLTDGTYVKTADLATLVTQAITRGDIDINDKISDPSVLAKITRLVGDTSA